VTSGAEDFDGLQGECTSTGGNVGEGAGVLGGEKDSVRKAVSEVGRVLCQSKGPLGPPQAFPAEAGGVGRGEQAAPPAKTFVPGPPNLAFRPVAIVLAARQELIAPEATHRKRRQQARWRSYEGIGKVRKLRAKARVTLTSARESLGSLHSHLLHDRDIIPIAIR